MVILLIKIAIDAKLTRPISFLSSQLLLGGTCNPGISIILEASRKQLWARERSLLTNI